MDLTAHIVAQLERLGIEVIGADSHGPNLKAYCFQGHDTKTPSLSIRKLDGAFYCFGCGVKGHDWNSLQKYLKVDPLSPDQLPDPFEVLSKRISSIRTRENATYSLPWDIEEWKGSWRRIPEKTLRKLDAVQYYDDFEHTYRILFPIYMYSELRGWTARRLDKEKEFAWRHAPNMASKSILYPFDLVVGMSPKSVVLVEGPYDAIRLINLRIPALAILGTNNFSPQNVVSLVNTGANEIILAMDGDPSGDKARQEIAPQLEDLFSVEHFHCPRGQDPGSVNQKFLKKLWRRARV